mmetsp:Transcript_47159/g.112007  ORF Transcript_47159/g.112007 Transcript_47159/m.112007 type:complete len:228 (+) Transcript_47159:80-763(+)|eukprot:CAMPEP_0181483904 /NCGR_PEP_ID=MMETSP1110-20121109/45686_1 /TAXON_ID=174948 /ORGANISM="Symbiodinium sp., Strain CCMP421" /LENGTH=227 /DNA_ID=CAMNT_0023609679 /DNA_START=26 /DNA_END=709 /DNA_ORIENTATION=+
MGEPRVIFLHGLESGCGGRKHRFLQQHYEHVICVDMHMSLFNLAKRNGIARNCLAHAFSTAPWNLLACSVQFSLDGCLQCQAAELAKASETGGVLVGSSWGGAVAVLAIAKGLWKGPAVLIAPAYGAAVGRSGWRDPAYAPAEVYASMTRNLAEGSSGRVIIVHSTKDDTVPIADSRAMAQATGLELVEVEDGDHGMKCLLEGTHPRLKSLIDKAWSHNGGLPPSKY